VERRRDSAVAKETPDDPRIYMAAERTLLAWIRTALALMAFGFVVARFGMFLRELAAAGSVPVQGRGLSLQLGLAIIVVGIFVAIVSAIRHQRYVRAIDEGDFRRRFGSTFAYVVVGVLAALGAAMAYVVLTL
jgi:putative membrane protein